MHKKINQTQNALKFSQFHKGFHLIYISSFNYCYCDTAKYFQTQSALKFSQFHIHFHLLIHSFIVVLEQSIDYFQVSGLSADSEAIWWGCGGVWDYSQ